MLALPAVAPAMWLGMLTGIAGQFPVLPVEPINWLDSLCLAYIAQIAHWLAAPDWALLTVHLGSLWSVAAAYAALLGRPWSCCCAGSGGDGDWPAARARSPVPPSRAARRGRGLCSGAVRLPAHPASTAAEADLVVRVLDVGQGDSILLDPPDGDPVLVDTGPPEDGVEDRLRELGIDSPRRDRDHPRPVRPRRDLGELLGSVHVDRSSTGAPTPGCTEPRSRPASSPTGSRRAASSIRAHCT